MTFIKDYRLDFSCDSEQKFLTLRGKEKLEEFKRLHTKYLGEYKYMYFLPNTGDYRMVFKNEHNKYYNRYGMYHKLHYDYELGEEGFKNAYHKTKYRKSLEMDNEAMNYRYARMWIVLKKRYIWYLRCDRYNW